MLDDQIIHEFPITDVAFDKEMILMVQKLTKAFEIAGVSQHIQIHNPHIRMLAEHHPHKIAADKSRPASYQNRSHSQSLSSKKIN